MKKEHKLPRIEMNNVTVAVLTILLLIFLVLEENSSFDSLPLYTVSFFSMIIMTGYFFKFGLHKNIIMFLLLLLFLYLFFILVYSILTFDKQGIVYSSKIFIYASIIFLFGFTIFDKLKLFIIALIPSFFSLIVFLWWLPNGETFKYSSFFANSNIFGYTMYLILFLHYVAFKSMDSIKSKIIFTPILIIDLLMIFLSTSRTVWLALIAGVIIYLFYRYIKVSKTFHKIIFFVIMLSVLIITYVYPKLYTMEIGRKLNAVIFEYSGKSLFTGRQDIFSKLFSVFEEKPLLGHGLSASATDYIPRVSHAHNMFLDLLLQTGIIGLLFYVFILYLIWVLLYPGNLNKNKNKFLSLFLAFFASIIIYQIFEKGLMQGSYSIRMFDWTIIAIGIALNKYNKSNEFEL